MRLVNNNGSRLKPKEKKENCEQRDVMRWEPEFSCSYSVMRKYDFSCFLAKSAQMIRWCSLDSYFSKTYSDGIWRNWIVFREVAPN